MIPKGLFSQIALLILAVAIVVTYIQPTFASISETQDQIGVYTRERSNVQDFNDLLQTRLEQIDGVFVADRNRLLTYMPDQVDPIAVMRDLETIATAAGVVIGDITDRGAVERERAAIYDTAERAEGPFAYSFSLSVRGSYSQIKSLLGQLGQNQYPLEVQLVEMSTEEGGFINATIILFTYANEPIVEATTTFEDVNVTYE